ncbi:MAG: SRPBCC family protein [Bacteroidales bacterium]|nr:SRPBCC family protein [Bacteroidales bacterium]
MAFYQLKTSQFIPATAEEVWGFVSSPANLKKITPPHMGFDITSGDLPEKMYPGMIISYHVRPMLGIRMIWVTEITHVEEKKFFVDEQRVGPYAMWHHEHHLEEADGGVWMRDIVSYRPPMGFLGALANRLFIRKQLNTIFDYRFRTVEKMFPGTSA